MYTIIFIQKVPKNLLFQRKAELNRNVQWEREGRLSLLNGRGFKYTMGP